MKEKESTSLRLRTGIEGKDGRLLTDTGEVKKRWMEHFSELLEGNRGEVYRYGVGRKGD